MRVCHLLEAAGGGSGQVAADLIRAGLEDGDDITLIYSPLRTDPRFLANVETLEGHIRIHRLPLARAVGFHDLKGLWQVARALGRFGPFDVVHSHSSKAGGLARLARFAAPGAVQVYCPHAFVTLRPGSSRLYRPAEWALGFLSDAIICVSQAEYRHARDVLHLSKDKLFVVPNGVPPCPAGAREAARARLGFPDGALIAGFVGRCVFQKNPLVALETFLAAASQRPSLCLVVIGDGDLLPSLHRRVEEAGLGARVRFFENQAARELVPAFDVLLSSSLYEGFSIVFLEALAAGVPLVATPVGGTEESILEGVTGFCAKDFSLPAFKDAFARFLALDDASRRSLSEAARARGALFSLARCAAATRKVYELCLTRARKGRL